MPKVTLSMEEYLALVDAARRTTTAVSEIQEEARSVVADVKKAKRKVSAYSRRYGRAYKQLRKKFTLKSGALKKGYNHKRLVRMAHAAAKKVKK